ncbi:hypothetical protein [Leucobacter luti]|uniref:hypothetical protein n=1 Tax=Leucobacter luti TaxID=340320 RepID=UPI001042C086|nr:hypothetical protein [Leucobacter luti]MCW2289004.1 hypothetical protein [Leucobacter luti]
MQALEARLIRQGFTRFPQNDVVASVGAEPVALLTLYDETQKRLALIRSIASKPPTAVVLGQGGEETVIVGQLRPVGVVAARGSYGDWAACVAGFCPVCAGGCWATGPGYLACLLTCCVGVLATCGIFN